MYEGTPEAGQWLRHRLDRLADPVRILVFPKPACPHCDDVARRLQELAAYSPRVHVEVVDIERKPLLAASYGIEMTPAIAVLSGGVRIGDTLIRYYGTPDEEALVDLIEDLIEVSRDEPEPAPTTTNWLATLERPLHVCAFVAAHGAPHSAAVHAMHRMAVANPLLGAAILVADDYPELARRYGVGQTPTILIGENVALSADVSAEFFLEAVRSAARG